MIDLTNMPKKQTKIINTYINTIAQKLGCTNATTIKLNNTYITTITLFDHHLQGHTYQAQKSIQLTANDFTTEETLTQTIKEHILSQLQIIAITFRTTIPSTITIDRPNTWLHTQTAKNIRTSQIQTIKSIIE